MSVLRAHFTTNHTSWENIKTWLPSGFKRAEVIGVVNLARLTGDISLLPTALWLCCMQGATLSKGMTHSDGEQETLSPEDLALCVEGSRKLMHSAFTTVMRSFSPPLSESCKSLVGVDSWTCRHIDLANTTLDMITSTTRQPNPMITNGPILLRKLLPGVCKGCIATIAERQREARHKAWMLLPSHFGLNIQGWS
ncbi:hypothetical protein C8Q76DRAFT_753969 [Earliella scabrosa]|nr:hypothetical protein C8Q76DRAFT_753969 [Earliella scabrosa]